MRTFVLNRLVDETGVSGTGIVAEGVQFSTGKVVITWLTGSSSVAVYDSLEDCIDVHGHNGQTVFQFKEDGDDDYELKVLKVIDWSAGE